jgi:site-specific recombinase XerD
MRSRLDAWRDFERIQRGRSEVSVNTYHRHVDEFISWLESQGRDTLPDAVKRSDVESFLKSLYFDKHNTNSTRAGKLSALRSYFGYLKVYDVIKKDPTAGIPSPRIHAKAPSKFTTRELQLLFAAPDITSARGLRDRAILMTIYAAGLRKFEACNLDMGDISDSGGHIRIVVHGKGNKDRVLVLRRKPAAVLRSWIIKRHGMQPATNALFLRLKGTIERLGQLSITHVLKKYARVVGIPSPDAFVHKLRATWATDLYDAGLDIMEICELAGWSDMNTARRYIQISKRALQKAAIPDRRWNELQLDDGGAHAQ